MEKSNDLIVQRIKQLMAEHGLNQSRFAQKIGMDKSGFSKRLTGDVSTGEGVINKIVLAFGVHKKWLTTGVGEQYIVNKEINIITDFNFTRVPVIQSHIQNEYLNNFSNTEFINNMYSIPERVDTSFEGKYRVFQIEGDAMSDGTEKSILNNDLVLGREVSLDSIDIKCDSMVRRIFMVVYKNGIIPRKFCSYNNVTREIRFEPLNFLYSDMTINIDDIFELYNVVRILGRDI